MEMFFRLGKMSKGEATLKGLCASKGTCGGLGWALFMQARSLLVTHVDEKKHHHQRKKKKEEFISY